MNLRTDASVTIRQSIQPGDLGRIVELHGHLYAEEFGFDHRFEAHVAESLGEFAARDDVGRGRLWIAESDGHLVGAIGIIEHEDDQAQLRWFLVRRDMRGRGLGSRMLSEALEYSRHAGFRSIYLWTVSPLTAAARLYTANGFTKTHETEYRHMWGTYLAEQWYAREL